MSSRPSWREFLGFARPVDRFSLEELERLHNELIRQTKIHRTRRSRLDQIDTRRTSLTGNKETFVETLRSIAELMIWGDQHEPRFFDFFLEKNVLYEFYEILSSSQNRRGEVATQVLQTLSIMILNIKNETSIFYLFSNNHLNNILQLDFDFTDEEVLAFYISFLKSISLKLNPRTIHFFFQKSEDGVGSSFPLYTEAIRFVGNKEGMVRAAVRTLTLNVYSVEDPDVQEFVVSKPASNYFTELALHAAEQCQVLDRLLLEAENTIADSYGALDSQMNRIEDMLSYFNDIFLTGAEVLCSRLASCLWEYFVGPALLHPLLEVGLRPSFSSAYGISGTGVFRAVSSLCVIERLFHILESPILCEAIACCLLSGENCFSTVCERATSRGGSLKPTAPFQSLATPDIDDHSTVQDVHQHPGGIQRTSREATTLKGLFVKYRESFLRCLSGDSTQIGTAAVRVLVSLMMHPGLDPDVLDVCGVLPFRSRVRRNLLSELTGNDDDESPPQTQTHDRRGSSPMENASHMSWQPSNQSVDEIPTATLTSKRLGTNALKFIRNLNPRKQRSSRSSPEEIEEPEGTSSPEQNPKPLKSEELMMALVQLTMLPTLPPLTITHITWIISQLTMTASTRPYHIDNPPTWTMGSTGESCIEAVNTALMVCQSSVANELRGIWCDALVYLIRQQWTKHLRHYTEPRMISSSTSLLDSVFSQKASELGSALFNAQGSVSSQQLAVRLRLGFSAQCALHVFFKIRRLVALTQLKQYLLTGRVDEDGGLTVVSTTELKRTELREGYTIGMTSSTIIPCTVAFIQGQEKAAYYSVQGLPERATSTEIDINADDIAGIAEVARSVPFVVLAAPSLNRINMGTVISSAPLMGSEPRVDAQHESWLHLRVRPSTSRFLESCEKAGTWNQPPWTCFRPLCDGHWVLAFHNPGEALHAKYLAQEYISKLSSLYCNVLSPLLSNEKPSSNGRLSVAQDA